MSEAMPQDGGDRKEEKKTGHWWHWLLAAAALAAVVAALAPTAKEAVRELPRALERLDWVWVPVAILAQGLMYICLAGILAAALGALGQRRVPFLSLIPTAAVFLLTNRALPGPAVGGMALLVTRLKRYGVPAETGQAVASTFFGADYVGFFALGLVSLPVLAAEGRLGPLRPRLLLAAVVLVLLGGAASAIVYRIPNLLETLAERAGRTLAHLRRGADSDRWAERGRSAVTAYRGRVSQLRRQPGALLLACTWSFAMHAVDAATLMLTVRAFGGSVDFSVASAGYLAGNLGAIVSFLPGGVGLYEGGMIAALHAVGGTLTAIAVAATLLYRLLSLWLPLPFCIGVIRRVLRSGMSLDKP